MTIEVPPSTVGKFPEKNALGSQDKTYIEVFWLFILFLQCWASNSGP
jgi:hypothetical protein